jgi:hypothetical protein
VILLLTLSLQQDTKPKCSTLLIPAKYTSTCGALNTARATEYAKTGLNLGQRVFQIRATPLLSGVILDIIGPVLDTLGLVLDTSGPHSGPQKVDIAGVLILTCRDVQPASV